MNRQRNRRGGALIEFAVVLPFSVMLFIGIGDLAVYFWRLVQVEDVARFAAASAAHESATYAAASERGIYEAARVLQEQVRRDSGHPGASVSLTRGYACPLAGGNEKDLTDRPQLCPEERVYLRITSDQAVSPILQPLRWLGYPEVAVSRHSIRVR